MIGQITQPGQGVRPMRRLTWENGGAYLGFAAVLLLLFLLYDPTDYARVKQTGHEISCAFLLIGAAAACGLYLTGRLNASSAAAVLVLCGFGLRLGFVITNPWNAYQHDVETLRSSGHLSYIYNLAAGRGLPKTNDWQFSHPPLHHFIAAVQLRLSQLLGFSEARANENLQLITTFYSSCIMVVLYKLLREIRVTGRPLVVCTMLICFHPSFFIFAGSINNDILTHLLCAAALLYLVRWYRAPSAKYALLLGVSTGLAMMTKFSAAMMGVVIAITVLYRYCFGQALPRTAFPFRSLAAQTGLFVLTAAPLGLWYQFRNLMLFHQPLGYVNPLNHEGPLYNGDQSILVRMICFPINELVSKLYPEPYGDHNIPMYALKTSLFGEYEWPARERVGWMLFYFSIFLVLLTAAAVLYVLLRREGNPLSAGFCLIFGLNGALWLISFVAFNRSYPFGCSMDFRYITAVLFSAVAFLGMADMQLRSARGGRLARLLCVGGEGLVVAFSALSVLFYL